MTTQTSTSIAQFLGAATQPRIYRVSNLIQAITNSTHRAFGISPEFPICARSVFLSYPYLDKLRRMDGKETKHERIGSLTGPNGHVLDKWRFTWDGGQCEFFVDCYANLDSSCAPLGWCFDKDNAHDPWISSLAQPLSPVTWESEDDGESWEIGDCIAVFQTNTKTMIERVCQIEPEKLSDCKNIQKTIPSCIRYPFVLQLFYKPGKSPIGRDSARPCLAYAVKAIPSSSNGSNTRYVFCEFNPNGEFIHDEFQTCPPREQILKSMFSLAKKHFGADPLSMGTMKDAFERLHPGKTYVRSLPQGSGCMVPIAIGIAATIMTILKLQ